jgi:hypothetical protein
MAILRTWKLPLKHGGLVYKNQIFQLSKEMQMMVSNLLMNIPEICLHLLHGALKPLNEILSFSIKLKLFLYPYVLNKRKNLIEGVSSRFLELDRCQRIVLKAQILASTPDSKALNQYSK